MYEQLNELFFWSADDMEMLWKDFQGAHKAGIELAKQQDLNTKLYFASNPVRSNLFVVADIPKTGFCRWGE